MIAGSNPNGRVVNGTKFHRYGYEFATYTGHAYMGLVNSA